MKVKCISNKAYIPNTDASGNLMENQEITDVIVGKVYLAKEGKIGGYVITDETGEEYWYPDDMFERLP